MAFQETPSLFPPRSYLHKQKPYSPPSGLHYDEETTVPLTAPRDAKKPSCKYCTLKNTLVPSENKRCLFHIIKDESPALTTQLTNYLPTCRDLVIPHTETSLSNGESVSVGEINNQINGVLQSIRRMVELVDFKASDLQRGMVVRLKECIQLINNGHPEDQRKQDDSYSISLQLDVSVDGADWPRLLGSCVYPNLQEEGFSHQISVLMDSIQECDMKKIIQSFNCFIESVQDKFDSNRSILKEYQTNINEMNRRLLSYMEKVPTNNALKEFEDDLNFIEHLSSMGQMTVKNFSNNSSMVFRKDLSKEAEAESDIMKFVLLQASALEKLLPVVTGSMFE